MRLIIAALLIVSFVFSSLSHAGWVSRRLMPGERVVGPKCKKNFDEKFRSAAIETLKRAQANGYKGYRDVNFAKFQAQIESKEVHVGCWPKNVIVNETGRTGAMYNVDMKSITLNHVMQSPDVTPEQFSIMAIHEHLGAFNHDDREGELSMAIQYMSENVNDGLQLLPIDEKPIQLAANEGGTSTGTGGGGDPYQFGIKYSFFKLYYEEIAKDLQAGKLTLEKARHQIRRLLDIRVIYWTVEKKAQAPKFEIMSYYSARYTCESRIRNGMGISVGVEYMNKATVDNIYTLYAYFKALAEAEGQSPRCLE